jgi:hypothetical protein
MHAHHLSAGAQDLNVAAGRIGAQLAACVLHTAKHVQTTKVHSREVLLLYDPTTSKTSSAGATSL